jgi:hypothetical protein
MLSKEGYFMKKRKTTLQMFELIDRLHECKEDLNYNVVIKGTNRLYHFEKNTHELEKIVKEMNELIKNMRRKGDIHGI